MIKFLFGICIGMFICETYGFKMSDLINAIDNLL